MKNKSKKKTPKAKPLFMRFLEKPIKIKSALRAGAKAYGGYARPA